MKPTPIVDLGRLHSGLLFFKRQKDTHEPSPSEELELKKNQVIDHIGKLKLLPTKRLENEVSWYFGPLGLDKQYFKNTSSEIISQHILQLYAAKVDAHVNNTPLKLKMFNESEDSAVFAIQSSPNQIDPPPNSNLELLSKSLPQDISGKALDPSSVSNTKSFQGMSPETKIEYDIEQNWLHEGYRVSPKPRDGLWRVHYYRTNGTIVDENPTHLSFYFLSRTQVTQSDVNSFDINEVGDPDFLRLASKGTLQLYQEVMTGYQKSSHLGVFVKMVQSETHSRLVLAYRRGTVHSFFSGLTTLYQGYQLLCPKKRVEQFSNGITIISIYLTSPDPESPLSGTASSSPSLPFYSPLITTSDTPTISRCVDSELLHKIMSEISLLYVLPRTSLSVLLLPNGGSKKLEKNKKKLSIQEVTYGFVVWKFVYMFLANLSLKKWSLASQVGNVNVQLEKVKERLRQDTYTESRVFAAIKKNPGLLSELYSDFSVKHKPTMDPSLASSLTGSYGNLTPHSQGHSRKNSQTRIARTHEELTKSIKRVCSTRIETDIFDLILLFNQLVVKTNFYKTNKTALAFQLKPDFLIGLYPIPPAALTFLVGSEFRGFHVRFRETGIGQVRIIQSENHEMFTRNSSMLFEQNYSRSLIQHRRAKDIPEGGSTGIILLSLEHQDKGPVAFAKYTNSLLDLEVDLDGTDPSKKQDWIFLSPSEATRGSLMELATIQAKLRGHPYWRSFATGKSQNFGGIPQSSIVFATCSTREYVLSFMKKYNLKEEECTKIQISGPSQRLGASEILSSKDKTIGIIDETGVLYDPNGINREELKRLISEKLSLNSYDQSILSSEGFFVSSQETDKKLPDGTHVYSGRTFREEFCLSKYASAQFFIPCEGHPNTVNIDNVRMLLDEKTGKPRFKFVIEVASMFFSDAARSFLEKNGVLFVKDSSSNKGSLISASLEVLLGQALTDEEYEKHVIVTVGNKEPEFISEYTNDIRKIVEENARSEFECLWREYQNNGTPLTLASDLISNKINELTSSIPSSKLWENKHLTDVIFKLAIPPSLSKLVGLETLKKRMPESYLKAIFASYLASKYVYRFGLKADAFSFYTFVEELLK